MSALSSGDSDPHIRVDAAGVSAEEQAAYVAYHEKVAAEAPGAVELLHASRKLFRRSADTEEHRRLLFHLGHLGTIEAYDVLRRYHAKENPALRGWCSLCLQECRSLLEQNILEKDEAVTVMTGAGGEGSKLRYFIVLSRPDNLAFTATQQRRLRKAFGDVCARKASRVERVSWKAHCVLLTLLVDWDVALDDVVMPSIRQANGARAFLREHYFATNVAKPTKEQMEEYLEFLEEQK